jgi:ATP-dependent protease ClpP protease subunit
MKSKIRMAGNKIAEVMIYDDIGKSWWGEAISAKQVDDALKSFGKVDTILVRINSAGGDVFEGTAMYNILKNHPASVDVEIEGMALSAATLPVMAGDVIRMAGNGYLMIHNPYSFMGGQAADFRKMADTLDMVTNNIAMTYAAKTGNAIDQLRKWMDAETWMTASEAVDNGFVDEVTNALEIAAQFDLTRFHNAPASAIARSKQRASCASDQMRSKLRAMSQRATELRGGK